MNPMKPRNFWNSRRIIGIAAMGAVAVLGLVFGLRRDAGRRPGRAEAVFTAVRGPLTISVTQNGSIQSRDRVVVRNEVEGRSTIIWIAEEGKTVNPGDLLVELDASRFEQTRIEQTVRVENAQAVMIQARENLDIVKNQSVSDVEDAELALKFAKLELEKFEQGESRQQLSQADADISIAREELQRAQEKAEWSSRLAEQGYLTRLELEADQLSLRRREIDLKLAEGKREMLTAYTFTMTRERLSSDIRKAERNLVRIQKKAQSDVIRAEADLRGRESEYERQNQRLDRILDMIAKCRITAPAAGMVIFATTMAGRRWDREPLGSGVEVVERQELIHLPAKSEMMAVIQIPESSLPKLRTGLPARIRVDAMPGRGFVGSLERIAILPNSAQQWLNPDLKVYDGDVFFSDGDAEMRPGMSCEVEIMVDHYEDAVYVPLQCVIRMENEPTVFIRGADGGISPRRVRTGLDNNRMVRIIEGLTGGEEVLLAPPLPQSSAPESRDAAPRAGESGPEQSA
ncbi:MAG: efflux transporter periplasmic adaptor subunit [Kiritimatiellae bacterium]|nr:efflux transporter periplasmic adaptor subunit [Kiritimatiellia bacterium]